MNLLNRLGFSLYTFIDNNIVYEKKFHRDPLHLQLIAIK